MKCVSRLIYEETCGALEFFLKNAICDVVTNTEHAHCKTVIAIDIIYKLKLEGRTLYTFGG
ncbi:hypothetical protein E2562_007718 [Oryza meyeriana var. granulata]|uniref:Histone H4 n=1 Tax=Oryza meyeriana var. granulata TaxID=110450 RepID=A0A6G1EIT0_9ORYZ|nr:hypothetical protein E2562_007718 [Oryza meyeriana var. granulata]